MIKKEVRRLSGSDKKRCSTAGGVCMKRTEGSGVHHRNNAEPLAVAGKTPSLGVFQNNFMLGATSLLIKHSGSVAADMRNL